MILFIGHRAIIICLLPRFNRKLVLFSGIFFIATIFFTKMYGSIGFFIANSVNMALRIGQRYFLGIIMYLYKYAIYAVMIYAYFLESVCTLRRKYSSSVHSIPLTCGV